LGPLVIQTFQHNRALVFDSGVGGLSVVEEIRKHLPDVSLDYVADDVFRPYGEKTVEALLERLPALISTLDIMLQPDVIIVACNTASTTALAAMREQVKTPIIGVVPAIKPAADAIARRVEQVLSDVDRKAREVYPETAFLIGPDTHEKRAKAFRSFGFEKVVGLMP